MATKKLTRPERRRAKRKSGSDGAAEPVTPKQYGAFQQAWDFFDAEVFGKSLPQVMITMQRRANSGGYYSHNRFAGRIANTYVSEVALNPDAFHGHDDKWICSVLAHEQTHAWQYEHGTPSSRGYHNRQWEKR